MRASPHLVRRYLGSRVRLSVFGRWNTTEYRGLRVLAHVFFFTAFAAFAAVALASFPAEVQRRPSCHQLRHIRMHKKLTEQLG
jgi:hypothetical protein